MTKEPLNEEVSARICKHMNKDHSSAVLAYAQYYGGEKNALQAKIRHLNEEYMELEVDGHSINIKFNHKLSDSEDAHKTLVSMLKDIPKD